MYDGGRPNEPPPPPSRLPIQPQPQYDPNYHLMQNPNNNNNMCYQNPNFHLQNPTYLNQYPNDVSQNPNHVAQNSNYSPQQSSSVSFQPRNSSQSSGAAGITVSTPTNPPSKENSPPKQPKMKKKEKISSNNAGTGREAGETGTTSEVLVPKAEVSVPNNSTPPQKPKESAPQPQRLVDGWQNSEKNLKKTRRAIEKARRTLLSSGEDVARWNALGYSMQEAPVLDQLMMLDAKIITFIHCFVGVRGITSLYELEAAICKNVRVKQFDELELGPLVRHPLVIHYFSLSSEVNTVHKITSEDIISYLWVYMSMENRKKVVATQFLHFIAQKRSLAVRDELGVRIQSLGSHVATIRKASKLEDKALGKFLKRSFKQKSNEKSTEQKEKQLDESLSVISQRTRLFSSVNEDFDGEDIMFVLSSSEENEDASNEGKLSSQSVKSCDRVSSCLYPSLNKERARLDPKCDLNSHTSTAGYNPDSEPSILRVFPLTNSSTRVFINTWKEACCYETVHEVFDRMLQFYNLTPKQRRQMKSLFLTNPGIGLLDVAITSIKCGLWDSIDDTPHAIDNHGFSDLVSDRSSKYKSIGVVPSVKSVTVEDSSMAIFIKTWKEACCNETVHKVFDRMLQFYKLTFKERKKMKSLFLAYPGIGLLDVAITSIKCGLWDSIDDTPHAIDNHGLSDLVSDRSSKYKSIGVEPSVKSVTIEDIIRKLTAYFEDDESSSNRKSHLDRQLILLGKLCGCEGWLAEQFAVEDFKSLGHGDFTTFLQKNLTQLPSVLINNLVGYIHEKCPFRVCISENQLIVLLSQALDSSWDDEAITKQKITLLLMRQFPSISFNILENGPTEDSFNNLRDQQSSAIAKCVLFSATLSGTYDYGNSLARNATDLGPSAGSLGPVSFDDAMKVLLRAPMLSDLHVWSHWDLVFAPSLGPLVGWLLNEVNSEKLLCLVTKEGKVVRVNPSATLDSYLEASLQGAPFRTAVELISLFSLYGGKRNLPLSLLKSHTHQAFQVIIKNSGENMGVTDAKLNYTDRATPVASRFFLDCLGYLPSEFRNFAADVLLFGLRSIVKDAPSSILCECNDIEQRIMLHGIGLTFGIVEWIDDYYTLRSTSNDPLNPSSISCLLPPKSKLTTSSSCGHTASKKLSSSKSDTRVSAETDRHADISNNKMDDDCMHNASEQCEHKDASFIIESIRREEFGLDTNVSETHSSMLKKQHARLGRALHCLSQELYSQDSHFLLELVQNADDNIYLEKIEPTLTFILRETGIIVLNNERGFSSHNIKALCDIGNSTKKGSGAGYIGQKGIGFKSVFRVTNAPEIHSNGFHVKFDISEGQIGFVLPTEVPPCSIDLFGEMASEDADKSNASCWNTCIVLPFRKKLLEKAAVNSIISMFSDLQPSLLLFLHRLRCIKFRNLLDDSLVVMRKEHVGDGIIKVSHGSEKMTWLAVSRTLQADGIRPDVQTTEIALAFTLGELEDGVYAAHLELQPVFAFLPLRAYGLKFILQGDFVLPSSREEVDGNSPWNQWLLSEFPDLFISAESSFCDLPCFRTNKGKAVSAYMSFVPLIGEVHGFFSCLPRMIISKLRMSNCLLLEDDSDTWVPPCKAIRRWNERARALLPDNILRDRLGLGLLDKNIILSDPLARALGIEEYGPRILLKVLSLLSLEEHGLKSMGIAWLQAWLNELYVLSFHSSGHGSVKTELETEIIDNLRKIPFIPLSDGTYVSVNEGTVWLHSEASNSGFDCEHGPRTFPNLYANLRMVNPDLLVSTAMFCEDTSLAGNVTRVLHSIGVQRLSEHEITKAHILPFISKEMITNRDKSLMTEYLSFVMLHLQSSCLDCRIEKSYILSDLRNKAFISTSYGYKRLVEVPIHFGKEYGNPIMVNKLIDGMDFKWHEVDAAYLTCPSTKSLSSGLTDWRNFFQEVGITDFIDVVQREKSITDISHSLKSSFSDGEIVSLDSIAMDWESDELFKLLSLLSLSGDRKRCEYMLEVVDTVWDSSYGDKTVGFCNLKSSGDSKSFKSSLMHSICNVPWVVSSMDDGLHYPKDLFHDCDTVRSVLGASAPYAVPKVKNKKLLGEIGLKTQVTLDDIFSILQVWRRSGTPFRASIAQMTRFYTFIWNELSTSRSKIMTDLCSGPYIFVPYARVLRHEDIVPGIFLSSEDVYWHDSTGSIEQIKMTNPSSECIDVTSGPSPNILSIVYPSLHDFFVNECGVDETPPFRSYLQMLLQLSSVGLPSNSANTVFQVFLKWADGIKSRLLGSDDIVYLRESLLNKETTILPTVQDKWVSLHMSFGLVCWCDDDNLKKEFKHSDNIDFIYFGELNNDDELLRGKVSVILKALGIPSISEVVTREAIYDGIQDSSFKASLVNWALPYAQRYIYNIHPLRYCKLKQTGFRNLNNLKVSVVDNLSSRNVIERGDIASKESSECNSLLQGNILFARAESDSHSVFMELSRLFFDGTPELNLANFLHMITTMVQSGINEEQLEFFILNSQKLPKLADKDDSVWALSSTVITSTISNKEENPSNPNINRGSTWNWPPASWKTAPDMNFAGTNGYRTQAAPVTQPNSNIPQEKFEPVDIDANWTIEDASMVPATSSILPHTEALEDPVADSTVDVELDTPNVISLSDDPEQDSSIFSRRDKVYYGNPKPQQAMKTGRQGETIASKYFKDMMGNAVVKWVNEIKETGFPYDIMIEEQGKTREYIEVKATTSAKKDWLSISTREWQFAAEKGDSYSIARVALLANNKAKITTFRNPVKLCQQGQLQLVVMMPKEQREFALVEM